MEYATARRLIVRLAARHPDLRSWEGQRLLAVIATMHAHEARVVERSVAAGGGPTSRVNWRVIEAQGDE